jgi:hypothetical protein
MQVVATRLAGNRLLMSVTTLGALARGHSSVGTHGCRTGSTSRYHSSTPVSHDINGRPLSLRLSVLAAGACLKPRGN